jgi:acetyl esterase/lipase/rhodanese-related sulfurtransferase
MFVFQARFGLWAALCVMGLAASAPAQDHTKDSLDAVKKALALKKAVLIDVREKGEWDQGHLKDAKLLPLSNLKEESLPTDLPQILPKDKIAYLHCAAGRRCLKAAEILRKHGYDVRPLKDGYKNLLTNGFAKADEPETIKLWPGKAPGETKELPPEQNISKPGQGLVAGKSVIRLTNVSTPTLAIYRPSKDKDTGAAVIVCPGGAHTILAYDLEGTEVADWLNQIGVTACVLKYRVPARDPKKRWGAAVQDAQRAVSLVRAKSPDWGIDGKRIGILGFSAGGETAGLTALFEERQYDAQDAIDKVSSRPDFAVLIYPGGFEEKGQGKLRDHFRVTKAAPPMFFAHAANDGVTALNSLLLATELKKAGVPAELHLYATGGHGFGLRPQPDKPCTQWPSACAAWMQTMGFTRTKAK